MSPLLKNRKDILSRQITKNCLISGLIAFGIMLFTFICHSNTLVGGDNTVLRMDLYHQYGPLYSELYDRLAQGNSLIYSWTSGLGGGFLGNFFNYCCSPFVIFMFICGHKNMPEAIALMIMFKAVVSAVTFTYYICKTNKSAEKFSSAFGVLYAFCGYFVAFSWNIMWLDAMAVFPLVILGVEKIINEKKPALFLVSLTFTMITNYYMAYMVCILSVIYFLYYYFCNYPLNDAPPRADENAFTRQEACAAENGLPQVKKSRKKKTPLMRKRFFSAGCIFAGAGFFSFLLSAFALLPVIFTLRTSSATSSSFPETLKVYFNFFDFIANHLPAVEPTIRSSGDPVLPNVCCGICCVVLLPFYFMSGRISGRRKIAAAALLGLFYLSFSINYLNYIWHGFHFPNDLPYRYSFAYSFILLTLVYKVVLCAGEFTKKEYTVAGIALLMFVVLTDKLGSANVEDKTVYFSLIFGIFYIVVFGMFRSPKYSKSTVGVLLSFLIVVEICFCNTGNYVMGQSKENYTSDYDDYQQISELVESGDEDLFYRTELSKLRARMDPCWYGYNGVSTFSSMAYEHTAKLMKSLGLFGNNINSYTYYPQTPVFNSFFSLKYIYDNNDYLSESPYYAFTASNDVYDAYRYNYPLPLAFSVNNAVKDWDTSSQNPFAVQNSLVESTTGVSDVLAFVDATNVEVSNLSPVSAATVNSGTSFFVDKTDKTAEGVATVTIDVAQAGDYYVYAGSTKLSRLKITAEDFKFDYLSSSIQPILMGVGYQPEGAQIVIEYTVDKANASGSITFCAARTDEAKFNEAYEKITSGGLLRLASFDESSFGGSITVANDNSFVFTSVPYDESWVITVDGVELKYYDEELYENDDGKIIAVGGGLIGFDIPAGEHEISFTYRPRGLSSGMLLTAVGIFILAVALIFRIVRKKLRKNKIPADSEGFILPDENSVVLGELEDIPAEQEGISEKADGAPGEADGVPGEADGVPGEADGAPEKTEKTEKNDM